MQSKSFHGKKSKKFKRMTYMSRVNKIFKLKKDDSKWNKLFYAFCEGTKINGIYYLRKEKTTSVARIFWTLVPLAMLVLTGVLIHLLAEVYDDNAVFINAGHPIFTSQTAFPSVTICPNEPVLPVKISRLVQMSKLPANASQYRTEIAIKAIGGFTRRTYTLEPDDISILDTFATLNNLSLSDILEQTEMKCHDFIEKYRYGLDFFDCTIEDCPGWKKIRTVHGTCCSFNYFPLDKPSASVLNQAGKLGGMNVLFSGSEMPSSGLTLIFSQPGSFITLSSEMFSLIPGFDNYFRLYLTNDVITSHFENLPLKSRQCMLPKDMGPSLFFRSRCTLSCIMEVIYEVCGCHPYYMPFITERSKTIRNCTIIDLVCIRNRTDIWDSPCSQCKPTCNEVRFRIGSSISILEYKSSKGTLNIYKNISQYENPFTVVIFHGRQTMKVAERHASYSWITLLANLGGILNLTLGVSFITVCEIFFYFLYKPFKIEYFKKF